MQNEILGLARKELTDERYVLNATVQVKDRPNVVYYRLYLSHLDWPLEASRSCNLCLALSTLSLVCDARIFLFIGIKPKKDKRRVSIPILRIQHIVKLSRVKQSPSS